MTRFAPVLESFFTGYLMTQRQASPNTITSYRDTFRLLAGYVHQQTGKPPAQLDFADLDSPVIGGFVKDLQETRGNSPATQNARLAAIHALFRYASLHVPEHAALISRVLSIRGKRTTTTLVAFLTRTELEAVLAAPDRTTWYGRRDHALLLLAGQTGLRVSELTALAIHDVTLGAGAHVRCEGKGRKQRCTPLTTQTSRVLATWMAERGGTGDDPLFCTRRARPLSRDAVARLVSIHARTASYQCPSLLAKTITPHTMRHTAAMELLHAGIDVTVIALWLGHESPTSSRAYLHADMALKEQALSRVTPHGTTSQRYVPPDELLAFLDQL
jgi:integrase/recombinase XerD